jgi:hypothetical protein
VGRRGSAQELNRANGSVYVNFLSWMCGFCGRSTAVPENAVMTDKVVGMFAKFGLQLFPSVEAAAE